MMKKFKHLLFLVVLFLSANQNTVAQGILSPDQQDQVVENVSDFINDLNLSERDKPAARVIIEDFFIGLVALRATDFPMTTNKKIMKALVKGRDSRAKNLLSTDQYKVYKARVKERQSNFKEFMKQQG